MKSRTESIDRATIVIAEGRLDFSAAGGFQKDMEQALSAAQQSATALIIDCSGMEYISSAGLRVFMLAARTAQRTGVSFALCSLQQPAREAFELSGFDRVMTVLPDRAAALARLEGAQ